MGEQQINKTVYQRLKQIYKEKNISQKELSELLNVSRQALYKWDLREYSNVPIDYIKIIADKYKINIMWLLGDDDVPKEIETEEHSELRKRLENKLLNASTEDLKQVEKFIDTFLEELKK